jgi:hypothetical protein
MKILVACEFSGIVRDAFIARGHQAVSCDIIPSMRSGPHLQTDVLSILNDGWDLMIAHPPCTYLCSSGARWWKTRQKEQKAAISFVKKLMKAPIPKIAIENPVGILSSSIRKPEQIIQPFHFGHPVIKTTCLWLKNLPKLDSTNIVTPKIVTLKTGARFSEWDYKISMNHKERSKLRSITFEGIAQAMAEQWGDESHTNRPDKSCGMDDGRQA